MLTQFRYNQFLVTIDSTTGRLEATRCVSISEAKRRNRKTRWPVVSSFKFPTDAVITPDFRKTPRSEA